ncbi:hypothetical protein TNCV_2618201 [Trichonephila clavipes]|nr:hypothetical protein TNCV_2618201 [Trichonephila clavipes]
MRSWTRSSLARHGDEQQQQVDSLLVYYVLRRYNTYMRRYPLETHLFPLTKLSQFGNNNQISTVHNLWSILQILDGTSVVYQDPDTVLIRVDSMRETLIAISHRVK